MLNSGVTAIIVLYCSSYTIAYSFNNTRPIESVWIIALALFGGVLPLSLLSHTVFQRLLRENAQRSLYALLYNKAKSVRRQFRYTKNRGELLDQLSANEADILCAAFERAEPVRRRLELLAIIGAYTKAALREFVTIATAIRLVIDCF